jgi:hypothetical protein
MLIHIHFTDLQSSRIFFGQRFNEREQPLAHRTPLLRPEEDQGRFTAVKGLAVKIFFIQ